MAFYDFKDDDIINTFIVAYPSYTVELNGNKITGSIYLEQPFLTGAAGLETRTYFGYSEKKGGYTQKTGPFSASIDIVDAELGSTNKQLYRSIVGLYDYYDILNSDYTPYFTGALSTRFRVISLPEIYYDSGVVTGSFTASDLDSAGNQRILYDNGLGGLYSGSVSGTIVGNIFYSEGLVALKGGGLNVENPSNDFGEVSPTNFKWRISFKGTHKIPVKIFRCRAPAGELNASTNSTFFTVPTGSSDPYRNEKQIVSPDSSVYITTVGLYNEEYELVGFARVAQPIKKELASDILFRLRLDF